MARTAGDDGAGAPARPRRRGQAARLAASYIAAGFVHGVLNTDNIAITAQSFDYGPWRFTPYLGRRLHRRLFRPCRPLFLRPPARGDPLGRGAARRRRCGRSPRPSALTAVARSLSGATSSAALRRRDLRAGSASRARRSRNGTRPARRARDARWRRRGRRSTVSSSTGAAAGAAARRRPTKPMPRSPSPTFARRSRLCAGRGALDHDYWSDERALLDAYRRGRGDLEPRSTRPTTGRRSTPRSPRSGAWARRCGATRLTARRQTWWFSRHGDPDLDRTRDRRHALDGRDRRRRCRGRRAPAPPGRAGRRGRSPSASRPCAASPTSCAARRRHSPTSSPARPASRSGRRATEVDAVVNKVDISVTRLFRAHLAAPARRRDGRARRRPPQAARRARRARPL